MATFFFPGTLRGQIHPLPTPEQIAAHNRAVQEAIAPVSRPKLRTRAAPRSDHPPELSGAELIGAYEAMTFAMRQYGVAMNASATFDYKLMGLTPHEAMSVLGNFNHEAAKCFRRLGRRHSLMVGYHYIAVHERGGKNDFHTHLLFYLPPEFRREFRRWGRECLARTVGVRELPKRAWFLNARHSIKSEINLQRAWLFFSYIMKQTKPGLGAPDKHGVRHDARTLFNLYSFRQMQTLPVAQAVQVSHSLGPTSRQRAGYVSRWERGEFATLRDGLELDDWRRENGG